MYRIIFCNLQGGGIREFRESQPISNKNCPSLATNKSHQPDTKLVQCCYLAADQ